MTLKVSPALTVVFESTHFIWIFMTWAFWYWRDPHKTRSDPAKFTSRKCKESLAAIVVGGLCCRCYKSCMCRAARFACSLNSPIVAQLCPLSGPWVSSGLSDPHCRTDTFLICFLFSCESLCVAQTILIVLAKLLKYAAAVWWYGGGWSCLERIVSALSFDEPIHSRLRCLYSNTSQNISKLQLKSSLRKWEGFTELIKMGQHLQV